MPDDKAGDPLIGNNLCTGLQKEETNCDEPHSKTTEDGTNIGAISDAGLYITDGAAVTGGDVSDQS